MLKSNSNSFLMDLEFRDEIFGLVLKGRSVLQETTHHQAPWLPDAEEPRPQADAQERFQVSPAAGSGNQNRL